MSPFDKGQYKALLEGLEANETLFSELENEITIGSEYYSPAFVKPFATLTASKLQIKSLRDCCSLITDGDHGSADYVDDGVTFILSEAVKNGWIDIKACRQISERHSRTLKRSQLKKHDVLITKTGIYFGKSAVVTDEFVGANTIAHVGIFRPKDDVDPYYLSTFFNSRYGYSQLRRRGIKATRPEIKLVEFQDISVGLPSAYFQKKIASILIRSHAVLAKSNLAYVHANTLLLETLGIANFSPSVSGVNIQSMTGSFFASGRLDAEYYQPKYEELKTKIAEKHSLAYLRDLLTLNQRGTQPEYCDGGVPVVNSKHVREDEVILNENRFGRPSGKKNELLIKKGDVLLNGTGVGTIGRAAAYMFETEALPDNHVTVLRSNKIDPVFLSVYLNSIAGKYQVEKYYKGSSGQIELYPAEIEQFYVPLVEKSVQLKVANSVRECFVLKAESERLLQIAKRAVEIAIERDEDAAEAYIKENS